MNFFNAYSGHHFCMIEEKKLIKKIAETVKKAGGRALLVGGFVRDYLMGIESKDIDLEVYGIKPPGLSNLLGQFGVVDEVGKSFGVFRLDDFNIEVSVPRIDSKVGAGHQGFDVKTDPTMTIAEAARRRDLTINAILMDPLTDEIIDPFNGREDIKNKILRAVDYKTFADDPLRVLRLAQLAARFNFAVENRTAELARSLNLSSLSQERVTEEFRKLFLKSEKPSAGLLVADDLKIIEKLFPELKILQTIDQEPEWHPEGNVWNHSLLAIDAAVELINADGKELFPKEKDSSTYIDIYRKLLKYEDEKLILILAVLCHDFGKKTTTERRLVRDQWRLTAYGHEQAGVSPATSFLSKFKLNKNINEKIIKLIGNHMFTTVNHKLSDSSVLRLAERLHPANILELVLVGAADRKGRGTQWTGYPEGLLLLKTANDLGVLVGQPKNLVSGQDLIAVGFKEGKELGQALNVIQKEYLKNPTMTPEEALKKAILLKKKPKYL